jgi:sec-independent protein translocase protein TatC
MKLRRAARPHVKTPDDRMTLVEHLAELRGRLIKSLLAITLGALVMFVFYDQILNFLAQPYFDVCKQHPDFGCSGDKFLITGPLDGFSTRVKVSGYGGLVVALPVVLWQLWRFITPGLHKNEKKYAIPFILSSVGLFLFGAFIAYFIMPYAIEFLIGYSGPVTAAFTPNKYVSLLSIMMLAFGVGFLFPVLLVFLQLVGILTPKQLSHWRRQAIVIVVVVAAVITPSGDPYSLIALAVPMYIFYECSIVIGWVLTRNKRRDLEPHPG